LSSKSSILKKRLTPPVTNTYKEVALVGFYATLLTPNVTKNNNKLYYETEKGKGKGKVLYFTKAI